MTELESIISAMCITNVVQVEDLTEDFSLEGVPFRLFLVPKDGGDVKVGDVVAFDAMLPYSGGEFVEVPVVVGEWNPLFLTAIKASEIDLTDMDAYVAPIKFYKQ
jgi:hypothetical protein